MSTIIIIYVYNNIIYEANCNAYVYITHKYASLKSEYEFANLLSTILSIWIILTII